ncbi:MAG: hypothetical protein QN144_13210 [Armatimonadota bacterium]|nr:hypothetical protein [Armatimonadota bacterium]
MKGRAVLWGVTVALLGAFLPQASAQGSREAKILNKVFYVDARTWPSQPELLRHLGRGKFYIPVQDDGLVAVVDPEKRGYIVKLIKVNAAQPHHPWVAPGMRYVYINHQSEGKGDHNVMTVIDSFTDEVVAEIKTDFDDPFHCAFHPARDLLLCGDLNPRGGYVYYIDPVRHRYLFKVKTTGTAARDVILSHDGRFAFVGHQGSGHVDVLHIDTRRIVKTLECDRCARMKMTPDGRYLFASSPPRDFTAVIDVERQEVVKRIDMPKGSAPGNINFGGNEGKVAMIGLGRAGKLALVDVNRLELWKVLDSGAGTNTAYANPADRTIAIATNDATDDWYTVVDLARGEVVERIEAGGKGTHNVHWSADGRFAVGSDRLGDTVTLFRFDTATRKVTKLASVPVGFGTNGVQWVPYFCGAPFLTQQNVKTVKNAPAVNGQGDCGR